jgi:hypothetical protein
LRENIEAGVFAQRGEPDRKLVLLVWLAILGTEIAQAKARARKSLLAKLCVERITQVSFRTNFSPTTSDFLNAKRIGVTAGRRHLISLIFTFYFSVRILAKIK